MKNYFLTSKNSRLINGHIDADDLYNKILNHDGSEAYCCYFDLDENYLKIEYDTHKKDPDGKPIYEYLRAGEKPDPDWKCNGKTFAKYEGPCKPALDCVSFDFDSDNLEDSLNDVCNFITAMGSDNYVLFFSGSKGFHLMVPFASFNLDASPHLPNQLKDLAKHLKETYSTLDDSIYNYNRKFRVPFTKHDKSGNWKLIIPNDKIKEIDADEILEGANNLSLFEIQHKFLDFITLKTKPLEFFTKALEESARKSYEIEKERAGTIDKPSPFEKFDNKLCIKKMLESRCDDIGRNNAALRIVNDYYRTGKPRSFCEKAMMAWAAEVELPLAEVSTIISNIYDRGANYNFGCQDECKSLYCTAKCDLWRKLDADKRPIVPDAPSDKESTWLKNDFVGVRWLMETVFGSPYDISTDTFEEGLVVKQDATNLFYYKDKYWQHLDESKIHILKTKLNAKCKNKLSARRLDAVFKMFVMYVPEKPDDVDLFSPSSDSANFLDGTLHMVRKDGSYKLEFKDHSKLDFCTTIIEQRFNDYLAEPERVNKDFESWLFEYLGESKESFNLVQEMFGASLMPKFPQFFVLIGKSGTGKSTTIKVLKKLHMNEKNISGVSPDKFHGFHMQSMVGKLMNIVSDIKTNCRIDDDVVKQVDDQDIVRIERKGKDDIYTKLPALHIFGANKMPSTNEGYSGAMKRRFSLINFDKQFVGKKNSEISSDMFDSDPLGILAFAMRGLKRLVEVNGGEFTVSGKSQKEVDEWASEENIISHFLDDMVQEGVDLGGEAFKINYQKDGMVLRNKLWKAFQKWQDEALSQRDQMGKMKFFNLMKHNGYIAKRRSDGFQIVGLCLVDPDDNSI